MIDYRLTRKARLAIPCPNLAFWRSTDASVSRKLHNAQLIKERQERGAELSPADDLYLRVASLPEETWQRMPDGRIDFWRTFAKVQELLAKE